MRPRDELGASVKGDGPTALKRQVPNRFHDLAHYGFRAFVGVLQQHGEAADALDQRGDIGLPK